MVPHRSGIARKSSAVEEYSRTMQRNRTVQPRNGTAEKCTGKTKIMMTRKEKAMENTVEKIDAKTMAYLIARELEDMRDENNLELDDLDMQKNMPEILIRLGRQEALQAALDCISRIEKEMVK